VGRPVIVTAYDPEWAVAYAEAATEARTLLGAALLRIEHVGSTAVPGLAAKPTIDLLAEVVGFAALEARCEALARAGWQRAANRLDAEHLLFLRRHGEHRTHHLHCFTRGSGHIRRMIAFRDYLRANPAVAAEYGVLKRALAAAHPRDIDGYMRGKDEFVKRHEAEAQKAL
jgi:GrpB-like predicted nucleotidyltransferase (UPF0157 family)